MMSDSSYRIDPIGFIESAHHTRHGTPRQAVVNDELVQRSDHQALLSLNPERVPLEALHDLDGFEYVWLIGVFHLNQGYKAKVIPPRGPRKARGYLATRSPHRPNRLSLSACPVQKIEGYKIYLKACDLLDGTPIFDLKPYIPFADAFSSAKAGWVDELPK